MPALRLPRRGCRRLAPLLATEQPPPPLALGYSSTTHSPGPEPLGPGLCRLPRTLVRNCPKRVLGTLLAWIWPVHGGQNGPRSTVSVVRRASLQAHPRLF